MLEVIVFHVQRGIGTNPYNKMKSQVVVFIPKISCYIFFVFSMLLRLANIDNWSQYFFKIS